jgi:hypothetical protein
MKRFYVNKYKVTYGRDKDGNDMFLESGTIFTIVGICGDMFELQPVQKVDNLEFPLLFGVPMLERGFTAQDSIGT